jgi:hypothetical protein
MINGNPQAAPEQDRKTYCDVTAQLGLIGLDPAIPEGVRDLAVRTVAHTREACDRSTDAFGASVAAFERSFVAAGKGAAAFRLGDEPGGSQGPLRRGEVAGGQLARASRCADGSSTRCPRALPSRQQVPLRRRSGRELVTRARAGVSQLRIAASCFSRMAPAFTRSTSRPSGARFPAGCGWHWRDPHNRSPGDQEQAALNQILALSREFAQSCGD